MRLIKIIGRVDDSGVGQPVVERVGLSRDSHGKQVKAELLDKLWTRMSERGDFPMLSQALRTTVSAMSDDDLDFTALVQVVLSDFGLTQKVLRLANSAMYMAFGGNITTVYARADGARHGRGRPSRGRAEARRSLSSQRAAPHRRQARTEPHAAVGRVARKLTERSDLRAGEEAVVCTLMRQIGKLLVAFYLEAEWDQLRRKADAEHISDSRRLRRAAWRHVRGNRHRSGRPLAPARHDPLGHGRVRPARDAR